MRRLVFVILLLVYPFQVALAMADKCCVTTPAGVTHHSAEPGYGTATAEAMFLVDDERSALTDPHCAACSFGHGIYLPSAFVVLSSVRHRTLRIGFIAPCRTSPPSERLERPKWLPAAH
jgi:hypothetical protein